uniref:Neuroparsin n=2 Tax=Timema TaxID=61471 RepID=A0A7R9IKM1_9NEOP|nr:unnamed protein product [Timema bartmani]CAD7460161.1 unnamed protein product [Timema tahoe]
MDEDPCLKYFMVTSTQRPARSPPTMYLSALLFISLTTAALLVISTESRSHPCTPCDEEECEIEPAGCRYGFARDNCNRKVCAKGPGEFCGGPSSIWGRCTDSLHCKCNRCSGCDTESVDCYNRENCVPLRRLIEGY